MEKFYAGIDLGGTRVKIGIVAGDEIIAQKIVAAQSTLGLSTYLPVLQQQIEELIIGHSLKMEGLQGVGLAFPGIANPLTNRILATNKKYEDAISLDLTGWAKETWGVSLMVDNDARMACAGEWKHGAGKGYDDIVMMTIGTGIGTSAIIEGQILRGKHFQAGCLGGHVSISYSGPACPCGNIGCVELYGGTLSLKKRFTSDMRYNDSLMNNTPDPDFKIVFDAAAKGDPLALEVREQCMNAWSAGIINLIHSYDPELVVMGGGVLKSADIILPYIKEKIKKHAWGSWGEIEVRASELEDNAAILGIVHCLKQKEAIDAK